MNSNTRNQVEIVSGPFVFKPTIQVDPEWLDKLKADVKKYKAKSRAAEKIALDLASAAIDMMAWHSPASEEMMRASIERWKMWQLKAKGKLTKPLMKKPVGQEENDKAHERHE